MGDAERAALAPSIAGHPNHLTAKVLTAQHLVCLHFDVMHCAVIQVDPQASCFTERAMHLFEARAKHSQELVETAPGVLVRSQAGAALTLALSGGTRTTGIVRR